MFERIKAWVNRHKIEVISGTIIAITGTIAYLIINGQKVAIPISELQKRIIPSPPNQITPQINKPSVSVPSSKTTDAVSSNKVTIPVDGVLKTFDRDGFIRKLHEGWHASENKRIQAEQIGIELQPNETLVNPCIVRLKAK